MLLVDERSLFELFWSRVRNEAVAIRHLHLRQRLRVNDRRLVDNIALGEDVGRNGVTSSLLSEPGAKYGIARLM